MKKIVLVDLENMPTVSCDSLPTTDTEYVVFYGIHNKNIPVQLLEAKATLIRSPKTGKDALDICLAYYFGKNVSDTCEYQIVSKDKGYDSMIEMVNSSFGKIIVTRVDDYSYIDKNGFDRISFIEDACVKALTKVLTGNSKMAPKTKKGMIKFMMNCSNKISSTQEEVEQVFESFVKAGKIKIKK